MNELELEENLAWYVNNSLPADQLAEIKLSVDQDETLQQEVEFLKKLRSQLKSRSDQSPGELGLQRLKRDIKQADSKPAPNRWKVFAIAASIFVVVQSAVLITLTEQSTDSQQAIDYAPLSGSDYAGTVLQIQFKDSANALQIKQLLLTVKGTVIEGPSAAGLYRVKLQASEVEIVKKHILTLQSQQQVVDFVTQE